MKILELLKRLTKAEKTKELKLEELNEWIENLSKKATDNTNQTLQNTQKALTEEKRKLKENLEKLKTAKLRNENIPERAKQLMQGNREAYINKTERLLQQATLPENHEEIPEFSRAFNSTLNNFGKGTLRSYAILMEFFANETTDISMNIKNLNNLINESKKTIENSKIKELNELKEETRKVEQEIKRKEESKETIKKEEEKLSEKNKKLKEKQSKLKKLEESEEHKRCLELKQEKEKLQKELKETERQQTETFSTIEPALKKYERLTLEDKLVRKYLEDPLKALQEDKELKIKTILAKMQESITKGKVELKEKKKEKILQELSHIDFTPFLQKHQELNQTLQKIKEDLVRATITEDIEQAKEELNQDIKEIQENKNKIQKLTEEKIDINELKRKLENNIKEHAHEEITVTL